jgi:hypothetical protein
VVKGLNDGASRALCINSQLVVDVGNETTQELDLTRRVFAAVEVDESDVGREEMCV